MSDDNVIPLKKGRKCPQCGQPTAHEFRPFCSKRCADIDLGRWFKESYRVATHETPDPGDEPANGD